MAANDIPSTMPFIDSPLTREKSARVARWHTKFLQANQDMDGVSNLAGLFNVVAMSLTSAMNCKLTSPAEQRARIEFLRALHKALKQLTAQLGKFLQQEVS